MSSVLNFNDLIRSLQVAKSDLDALDNRIGNELNIVDAHRAAIDRSYININTLETKRKALMDVVHSVSMAMARTIEDNRQQTSLAYHYKKMEEESLHVGIVVESA